MIYPKINRTKSGKFTFNWVSTRTGFRFGTNSIRRWIWYPFSAVAWSSRKNHRDRLKRLGGERQNAAFMDLVSHVGKIILDTSPAPPLPPQRPQGVATVRQAEQPADQSGDSLLASAAIGYATDNAAIGGIIGGDILGGIVGDAMNDGVVDCGGSAD